MQLPRFSIFPPQLLADKVAGGMRSPHFRRYCSAHRCQLHRMLWPYMAISACALFLKRSMGDLAVCAAAVMRSGAIWAVCLSALLGAAVCSAQSGVGASGAAVDAAEEKSVNVVFRTVGFDGNTKAPEAFVYVAANRSVGSMENAVDVPAFRRSAPYSYSGSPSLAFYRQSELRDAIAVAGGNTAAALAALPPAGQVRIPHGVSRVLLLFIPSAQGRYQIVALDDSEQSFAAGTARVFNATNQTLALRFMDETPTLIAPGATAAARGNGVNVRMQIAWRPQSAWEIVASPMFALRPTQRRTVFLTFSDADYFKLEGLDGTLLEREPLQVFTIVE